MSATPFNSCDKERSAPDREDEVLKTALATYRRELPDSHPRTAEALTALGRS